MYQITPKKNRNEARIIIQKIPSFHILQASRSRSDVYWDLMEFCCCPYIIILEAECVCVCVEGCDTEFGRN